MIAYAHAPNVPHAHHETLRGELHRPVRAHIMNACAHAPERIPMCAHPGIRAIQVHANQPAYVHANSSAYKHAHAHAHAHAHVHALAYAAVCDIMHLYYADVHHRRRLRKLCRCIDYRRDAFRCSNACAHACVPARPLRKRMLARGYGTLHARAHVHAMRTHVRAGDLGAVRACACVFQLPASCSCART
jgi:hypothetical protein